MPADQFAAVNLYIRRRFWLRANAAWDVPGLQALADKCFEEGTETVTITGTNTQAGGDASGAVTFDKLTLLHAVEALLAEADPTGQPTTGPAQQTQARFR